jgi:glycosyltransferase involved in cell wall biosynthesis
VDAVAAGNEVLAGVARRTAREVRILPTSIDSGAYRAARRGAVPPAGAAPALRDAVPTIVWIGSPENLVYLEMIRPALVRLTRRFPSLKIRIICSRFPDWPGLHVERVAWSAATETAGLATAGIGVMPLSDDEWSRGKCAFKLLQYMAAALPCVASPIGANTEAVLDGITGFHAHTGDEWEGVLGRLIESPGLAHVEARYAMRAYQSDYLTLLTGLAARRGR